jgi:two-component system, OmpR family, sensor histidine kinase VicK
LYQVISNLLNNALQFSKDGIITISFLLKKTDKKKENTKKATVCISTKDTGKGISPDFMPKIFTAFATKSNKGTGLGLYISNKIVESYDCRIWAENNNKKGEEEEKGSTFVFELPLIN